MAKNSHRRKGDKDMALSRKMLEDMGLEDTQISKIINAHSETVDGLKSEIKTHEAKISELENSNKDLEDKVTKANEKFDKEHSDFEEFKKSQADKDVTAKKQKAYKELLKEAGISEKAHDSICKVTDLKDYELDDEGKFKDADKLKKSIGDEWAGFKVKTETKGAETPNPSGNASGSKKTIEEIDAIKDPVERQQAMAENLELYGIE